jgi:hypothetical protein
MSFRDHPEAVIEISRRDLEDIIEGAARRGANQALSALGITDKDGIEDVKELRSLLTTWKNMRKTAVTTVVQFLTVGFLGILSAGLAVKFGIFGDIGK